MTRHGRRIEMQADIEARAPDQSGLSSPFTKEVILTDISLHFLVQGGMFTSLFK